MFRKLEPLQLPHLPYHQRHSDRLPILLGFHPKKLHQLLRFPSRLLCHYQIHPWTLHFLDLAGHQSCDQLWSWRNRWMLFHVSWRLVENPWFRRLQLQPTLPSSYLDLLCCDPWWSSCNHQKPFRLRSYIQCHLQYLVQTTHLRHPYHRLAMELLVLEQLRHPYHRLAMELLVQPFLRHPYRRLAMQLLALELLVLLVLELLVLGRLLLRLPSRHVAFQTTCFVVLEQSALREQLLRLIEQWRERLWRLRLLVLIDLT